MRFATSADTPKSLANAGTAALGVEEAKVHVMVARDATPVRVHLYAYLDGHAINNHKIQCITKAHEKFIGLVGSSGPSQVTSFGSLWSSGGGGPPFGGSPGPLGGGSCGSSPPSSCISRSAVSA
jgi:hypothetical protein